MEELPGALCQALPQWSLCVVGETEVDLLEEVLGRWTLQSDRVQGGLPGEGTGQQDQKEARAFTGQGGGGQINAIIPLLSASWKRGASTILLACFEDSGDIHM